VACPAANDRVRVCVRAMRWVGDGARSGWPPCACVRCDGWAMELGRDGRRPYRGCAQSGHERWAPCRAVARQRQEQNLAGAPSASRRRRRRRRTHARPPCSRHTALQRETRAGDQHDRPCAGSRQRGRREARRGGESRGLLLWAVEGLEVEETQDAEYVRAR
jgi:hypothetical protein